MEAIYTLTAYFHAEERDEDLIELNETVITEGQDWSGLYPMLADAYSRTEQYDKAAQYYGQAYPSFTDDPDFLQTYARFLVEEGKRPAALELIRQLQMLEPDNPEWIDWAQSLEME